MGKGSERRCFDGRARAGRRDAEIHAWSPGAIGTWEILEADGSASDFIITSNTAAGADLKFFSDPSLPVPEPATWAMMLVGLFGLGAAMRSRRQLAAATA